MSARRRDRWQMTWAWAVCSVWLTQGGCGGDTVATFGGNDTTASSTAASAGGGGSGGATSAGGEGGEGGEDGQGGVGGEGGGTGGGGVGEPIEAPAGVWTWVDFDDAFCANGETTGIGLNPGSSDVVLIYLQGGGACWSEATCYGPQPTAVNMESGFDEAAWASVGSLVTDGVFDRGDADNPLRHASFVYVPYCTGDVHAGDNVVTYGDRETRHVGHANMAAYLDRLVPTFPAASRVVLAGSSAGGFGALMSWDQAQAAFGEVRVDLIDDSGPWLPAPYLSNALQLTFRTQWNLAASLPAGCDACDDELAATYDHLAKSHPGARAALLTYTGDPVIAAYFGINLLQFAEALGTLAPAFAANSNLHYFAKGGAGHVLLTGGWGGNDIQGTSLREWVTQMLDDDSDWESLPAN